MNRSQNFLDTVKTVEEIYLPKLKVILEETREGKSFITSCENQGLNPSWVRRFIKSTEKDFKDIKEERLDYTDYLVTWKEKLLYDIFEREDIPVCEDFDEIYKIWLSNLGEREQHILKEYYENSRTVEDIAKEYNLTKQRISDIRNKSLKKLRSPSMLLLYIRGIGTYNENKRLNSVLEAGYNRGIEKNDKLLEAINENLLYKRLDTCDLPSSVYTTLIMNDIYRIGDLLNHTKEEIENMRNVGAKKFQIIVEFLDKYGLELRES